MRMRFAVDKAVDLSGVKAGESVNFTLKPNGPEDYFITKIGKK